VTSASSRSAPVSQESLKALVAALATAAVSGRLDLALIIVAVAVVVVVMLVLVMINVVIDKIV
jgi:hypothetical protein